MRRPAAPTIIAAVIGSFLLGCTSPDEPEERATLEVSLERIGDVYTARFTADVPEGAENVTLWFGDGDTVDDDLSPTHTYRFNASYMASLFYDDPLGGGRANVNLDIAGLPVPPEALDLPSGPGTRLVAVNHYGFLHNYEVNEAAHPWLLGSEAVAIDVDDAGSPASVDDVVIHFYASDGDDPRTVALDVDKNRSYASFGDEAHALSPGWSIGERQLTSGGRGMPRTARTPAPEPNVPVVLQNAEIPVDETLDLRLRWSVQGGVDGLVYTLIGPDGSFQATLDAPDGIGMVRVSPDELAPLGLGVAGLYTTLYTEEHVDDVIVRTVNVGYTPVWLHPTAGWSPEP